MATTSSSKHPQESRLDLEIERLHDVYNDETMDETQRRAAVAQTAEWLLSMWREERLFLQKTALPLLSFFMFEMARDREEEEDDEDEDDGEGPWTRKWWMFGAWMPVFRRVLDSTTHSGCAEFFVRQIALEFNTFARILGNNEALGDELSNVVKCFMAIAGRHSLCVETLVKAFTRQIASKEAKLRLLRVVDETETLTPSQKASFFAEICRVEAVKGVREQAASLLQPLATYVSSVFDVIQLLGSTSRKMRKIGINCLIDLGTERLREEVEQETVAETIVDMAQHAWGAQQEKRVAAFASSFFATATSFDEVCRLSALVDEAGKAVDLRIRDILTQAASMVLKPSMFHDHHSKYGRPLPC